MSSVYICMCVCVRIGPFCLESLNSFRFRLDGWREGSFSLRDGRWREVSKSSPSRFLPAIQPSIFFFSLF